MLVFDNVFNLFAVALAFTLVGLNIFITHKIFNILDLTCNISLPLGGCVYAALIMCGTNPIIAAICATFSGALLGVITSSLMFNIKFSPVFASIITFTAFQAIVLKLTVFQNNTPIKTHPFATMIITIIIVACIFMAFAKFMNSEYGLAMRVCSNGKIISESLGIDSEKITTLGLALGNSFSAIAGILIAQTLGKAPTDIGYGALVFGIASIMIGQKFISSCSMNCKILSCFIGTFLYKFVLDFCLLSTSNNNEYNGIIISLVLIILIAVTQDNSQKISKNY